MPVVSIMWISLRLTAYIKNLKKKGIRFYIAENDGIVNNELQRYGAGHLLEDGTVQKDIEDVLTLCKLKEPYPLSENNPYYNI